MVKTLILNSSNVNNTDNSSYVYRFPNSFQINQGDKISLAALTIPYSNYNINNELYNNAKLSIIYNGQTTNILIPNGSYSIETLNEFIHGVIKLTSNNLPYSTTGSGSSIAYNYFINFSTNQTYYSIDLIINPAILGTGANPKGAVFTGFCPQVVINSNISKIIGFNKESYPNTINRSTDFIIRSKDMGLIPNISPVNSYIMLCNLAYNSASGQNTNILYSITSGGVEFGNNIYLSLPQYQFVDTIAGTYPTLEINFVDQNFGRVIFNDYNLLITIIIKSKDE
jgi:hypothetical protein